MNLFEILRAVILAIGWPFLIFGSIFILYKQIVFNRELGQPALARIMLIMILGWFITMYSLGISATLLMFENLVLGVKIIMPVFLIWFVTMIVLIAMAKRANSEVLKIQKFYQELTKGVENIVSENFDFQIEIEDGRSKEVRDNVVMFNKMVAEIKLTKERLEKSNWQQIKELEEKIEDLEKTRNNLEEKLRDYI